MPSKVLNNVVIDRSEKSGLSFEDRDSKSSENILIDRVIINSGYPNHYITATDKESVEIRAKISEHLEGVFIDYYNLINNKLKSGKSVEEQDIRSMQSFESSFGLLRLNMQKSYAKYTLEIAKDSMKTIINPDKTNPELMELLNHSLIENNYLALSPDTKISYYDDILIKLEKIIKSYVSDDFINTPIISEALKSIPEPIRYHCRLYTNIHNIKNVTRIGQIGQSEANIYATKMPEMLQFFKDMKHAVLNEAQRQAEAEQAEFCFDYRSSPETASFIKTLQEAIIAAEAHETKDDLFDVPNDAVEVNTPLTRAKTENLIATFQLMLDMNEQQYYEASLYGQIPPEHNPLLTLLVRYNTILKQIIAKLNDYKDLFPNKTVTPQKFYTSTEVSIHEDLKWDPAKQEPLSQNTQSQSDGTAVEVPPESANAMRLFGIATMETTPLISVDSEEQGQSAIEYLTADDYETDLDPSLLGNARHNSDRVNEQDNQSELSVSYSFSA